MRKRTVGFTLVELLVVIAIIAMLVTLLLPAVQSAREAARRAQCQNNLKNLALACLNYESAAQQLPPNYTPGGCCGTPSYDTWTVAILPYVEEQPLYDTYNFDLPNDCSSGDAECAISNKIVRETRLSLHLCPSETATEQPEQPESGPGSGELYARGSYRGNAGRSNGHPRWWDSQENIGQLPKGWRGPFATSCGPQELWDKPGSSRGYCEGPNALRSVVKMRHIADGTSKTLLIGEQTNNDTEVSAVRRRTFWAYAYTSYNKSEVIPESRVIFGDYQRCASFGEINDCKRGWGTAHTGKSIMFSFVDGSVHSISSSVDMDIMAAFASVNGQESVPSL